MTADAKLPNPGGKCRVSEIGCLQVLLENMEYPLSGYKEWILEVLLAHSPSFLLISPCRGL